MWLITLKSDGSGCANNRLNSSNPASLVPRVDSGWSGSVEDFSWSIISCKSSIWWSVPTDNMCFYQQLWRLLLFLNTLKLYWDIAFVLIDISAKSFATNWHITTLEDLDSHQGKGSSKISKSKCERTRKWVKTIWWRKRESVKYCRIFFCCTSRWSPSSQVIHTYGWIYLDNQIGPFLALITAIFHSSQQIHDVAILLLWSKHHKGILPWVLGKSQ